ncbi:ASKHA domain-containing protein [Pleomorphomonas sp. JP5]|uniref:ASKHA domain-containing protein n=1 Tax=Pleomorphomonas sp. JP5 TaxID=2942998 RepID=UPI00204466D7|nr:ASKHA domain-containing protein [Pleomorphomonas sp. JP5]MCM5559353.1 ASKHA domain-containing protein [Pleomorphomonas sp. JP5]
MARAAKAGAAANIDEIMSQLHAITFQPSGLAASTDGNQSILTIARHVGLALESACGGHGTCRSCAVRIEGRGLPASSSQEHGFTDEEIAAGWRRACKTFPAGDCTVHVPERGSVRSVSAGKQATLDHVPIERPLLVPAMDRCWRRGAALVGPVAGPAPLGLAVDLGTTNLAAAVVDMTSGQVLRSGSRPNPQTVFGGDIIGRLTHALAGDEQRRQLQASAVSGIAALADELTDGETTRIGEVAVAGNTVMQHLLLGLAVDGLAKVPFTPTTKAAVERPAADFGLAVAPGAQLYCAPSIAGFVGGDHIAALIAVLANPPSGTWALLDIGTNTEISLHANGKLTSVSCASGPAFEGAGLSCGMRAAPGAIDYVHIDDDLHLSIIGEQPPVGVCGSGALSLVAALRRSGIVNARGRLDKDRLRVREQSGKREFVLTDERADPPLAFTQTDIRAIQLAKGAIRTGLDLLLREAGLSSQDIDHILVAGAFGNFIDIDDAITVGLLPDVPRKSVEQIGNVAGTGACRLVACGGARSQAVRLATEVRYLELAVQPDFDTVFASNCLM